MTFLAKTPVLFAILLIFTSNVSAQTAQGAAPTQAVNTTSALSQTIGQPPQQNTTQSASPTAIITGSPAPSQSNGTAPVAQSPVPSTTIAPSPPTTTFVVTTPQPLVGSTLPQNQSLVVSSGPLPHAHSTEANVKPLTNQAVAAAPQQPSQSSTSQPQPYFDNSNSNKAALVPPASSSLSPLAISLIVVAALSFVAAVLGFIGYRYTTNNRRRSN